MLSGLSAANAFADYSGDDLSKLSELLTLATPEQFAALYPIVAASPSLAMIQGLAEIAATPPPDALGRWIACSSVNVARTPR